MSNQRDPISLQGDEHLLPDLPTLRGQFVQGYQSGRDDGETVYKYHPEEETEQDLTEYLWMWAMEPNLPIPWRMGYLYGFVEADGERRAAMGLGRFLVSMEADLDVRL